MFQRDYLGVITGTNLTPEELASQLCEHFVEFAPPETAVFENHCGVDHPSLKVGDELQIRIGGVLPCRVRVVHIAGRSLTLRTLEGHPEAGRITFCTGRHEQGGLTFQIRSRARAGSFFHYLGFLLVGRAMQARCWIRFIGRVAKASGGRLTEPVRVRTTRVEDEPADCDGPDLPTISDSEA